MPEPLLSHKARQFTESVIRTMTLEARRHGAVNLSQGFPDFDPPEELIDAAAAALRDGKNQYAVTWGSPAFREAIARKVRTFNGIECDPDLDVTVTCGATEAMIATLLALVDPGDEVVTFDPFYENYGPDSILSGASPRYVPLREDATGRFGFDPDELRAACGPRARAIILNTPHNPLGKVFTREELLQIANVAIDRDLFVVTDEIYEHILYGGRRHVSIATLPGMMERTVTISGASKTYSVTGWRLAWAIARPEIAAGIRKVHDFLTVGAPHPLQEAGAFALSLPDSYYARLAEDYDRKRRILLGYLREAGFRCHDPEGAYYVMTDIRDLGWDDDVALARHLVRDVGVAAVPGSSFYKDAALGRTKLRFTFTKRDETLHAAGERLRAWRDR